MNLNPDFDLAQNIYIHATTLLGFQPMGGKGLKISDLIDHNKNMSVMYFRLNFEAASDQENHGAPPKFDILKKAYNLG